jgi:hypothetical protein
MNCTLCGYKFTEYNIACESCILNKSCNLICCPNCGYKFPQESKIYNYILKKFKKEKSDATT